MHDNLKIVLTYDVYFFPFDVIIHIFWLNELVETISYQKKRSYSFFFFAVSCNFLLYIANFWCVQFSILLELDGIGNELNEYHTLEILSSGRNFRLSYVIYLMHFACVKETILPFFRMPNNSSLEPYLGGVL